MRFGINEIDNQHTEIMQIVNGLLATIGERSSLLDVYYRVAHLYDVTLQHFRLEESLMRIFRYPLLDEHVAIHAGMMARIGVLKDLSLRDDEIDWAELDTKKAFLVHMDEHDRKFCDFILAIPYFQFDSATQWQAIRSSQPTRQALRPE